MYPIPKKIVNNQLNANIGLNTKKLDQNEYKSQQVFKKRIQNSNSNPSDYDSKIETELDSIPFTLYKEQSRSDPSELTDASTSESEQLNPPHTIAYNKKTNEQSVRFKFESTDDSISEKELASKIKANEHFPIFKFDSNYNNEDSSSCDAYSYSEDESNDINNTHPIKSVQSNPIAMPQRVEMQKKLTKIKTEIYEKAYGEQISHYLPFNEHMLSDEALLNNLIEKQEKELGKQNNTLFAVKKITGSIISQGKNPNDELNKFFDIETNQVTRTYPERPVRLEGSETSQPMNICPKGKEKKTEQDEQIVDYEDAHERLPSYDPFDEQLLENAIARQNEKIAKQTPAEAIRRQRDKGEDLLRDIERKRIVNPPLYPIPVKKSIEAAPQTVPKSLPQQTPFRIVTKPSARSGLIPTDGNPKSPRSIPLEKNNPQPQKFSPRDTTSIRQRGRRISNENKDPAPRSRSATPDQIQRPVGEIVPTKPSTTKYTLN